MIYDYKNRIRVCETPAEEMEYTKHMADFGPKTGKSHPDDCAYCAARGWKTFPGTSFEKECDRYEEEHPEEFEN
jgi:hypothetical protein